MFGGTGVWHQGLMIGLVAHDTLYLKVDDQTRGQFEALRLSAFEYTRQGKTVALSYYRAPEEMLEAPAEAVAWARLAYAAALRVVRPGGDVPLSRPRPATRLRRAHPKG